MKMVDYETFCRMPAGTVFAPYTPCVLEGEISIKVDGGNHTWKQLFGNRCYFNGVMPLIPSLGPDDAPFEIGEEKPALFETCDLTDTDYRHYKTFLIFDEVDINSMIYTLMWAKAGCFGNNDASITKLDIW